MFCFSQPSSQAFADVFFVLETSKMSLVAYAAERAMVFDLVAQTQEKLLAVPGVVLLLVVLVPLLVGVVLGVQYQKFRAETRRVRATCRTCLFSCPGLAKRWLSLLPLTVTAVTCAGTAMASETRTRIALLRSSLGTSDSFCDVGGCRRSVLCPVAL